MKNLFSGTYSETMNIRNKLENINIEVFIQNENMGTIQPWTITSGGFNPIILKVKDEDYKNAKKLIEEYDNGNLNIE